MWDKKINVNKPNGAVADKGTEAKIEGAAVAKLMDRFERFVRAQQHAENTKSSQFTCPLCGGKANWKRSMVNKRLTSRCSNCEFGFQG